MALSTRIGVAHLLPSAPPLVPVGSRKFLKLADGIIVTNVFAA